LEHAVSFDAEIRRVKLVERLLISKGDLPGHQFHGNQWVQGEGSEIFWKPVMSRAEADQWAKDSSIQIPLYHGTAEEYKNLIEQSGFKTGGGIVGHGVYLTNQKHDAQGWADNAEMIARRIFARTYPGSVLEVRVNVHHVATIQQAYDLLDETNKLLDEDRNNKIYRDYDDVFTELAKQHGYDAIAVEPDPDYRQGQTYYVVLDPKNVVVVSDEVKKGDFDGHPFRGNQWQNGDAEMPAERLDNFRNYYKDAGFARNPRLLLSLDCYVNGAAVNGDDEGDKFNQMNGHFDMNEMLRAGNTGFSDPKDDALVQPLIRATKEMKIPDGEPLVVYRGIEGLHNEADKRKFASLQVGDTFTEKGFSSTSTSQQSARAWAHEYGFRITCPPETRGLMVDALMPQGEKEFILPPSTTFRVVGRSDKWIDLVVDRQATGLLAGW
jgi:ADP-ribosyltransferase exoenzyme